MAKAQKLAQIRHAAELYYEQDLGQQDISKILGCSLSTVSRFIAEARDLGVVEFRIRRPVDNIPELAAELRQRFHLRDAVVAPSGSTEKLNFRNVGIAATEFLTGVINDRMKVGITGGRTLTEMLRVMEPRAFDGVEVVQISGSLESSVSDEYGPKTAIRLAEILHASCHLIPAPALADSREARDLFVRQPQIRRAIDHAADVDVIIQGIETLSPGQSSLQRANYITEEQRKAAVTRGAVGHVFARMIDVHGREVGDCSDRVIGIPLERMRNATWSIGVSASPDKAPAVLGALRGGYVNAVVTEEETAREVLKMAVAKPARGSSAA